MVFSNLKSFSDICPAQGKRCYVYAQKTSSSVVRNRARAALGWFDEYIEKAAEFANLRAAGVGSKKLDARMAWFAIM